VRSRATSTSGHVYEYAYVRYEVWDETKKRLQPVPVASLGRTDRIEEWRLQSLGGFLREWLRKDSSLPFEALKSRFEMAEPVLRILCSRDFGLRFVAEQIWREIGYKDAVAAIAANEAKARKIEIAIFAMVLVQLVAPQSKRAALDWTDVELFFPEANELELDDIYDAMDVLVKRYDLVEQKLAEALRAHDATPVEFGEDTTTVACRIRYDDVERAAIEKAREERGEVVRPAVVNDPPLRMRGASKDKRGDLPQIVVEAVMGENKIVVHHTTQAGNASDKKLVEPTVAALTRLGYTEVRWASDAGFNSAKNRESLRAARWDYVSGEGTARTSVVKEVLARAGRYTQHPKRPELSYKCVRTEAREERRRGSKVPARQRLYVIRRNSEEEAYALHTLDRHLKAIGEALAKGGGEAEKLLSDRTYRRYVRRDARTKDAEGRPIGPVILNRKAVEHARLLAGKSVIGTDDLDACPLERDELFRITGELEALFRDLKSTIEVGPVRHRRADRIKAHVMIAIMAYNLGVWITRRAGLTIEATRRLLANLRVQEVSLDGARFWQRTELTRTQRAFFAKLGLDEPPERFVVSPTETTAPHGSAQGRLGCMPTIKRRSSVPDR